jgi:hypothetical protein
MPASPGARRCPPRDQLTKADTSSPTKLDPEDVKVNKMIKDICRGC